MLIFPVRSRKRAAGVHPEKVTGLPAPRTPEGAAHANLRGVGALATTEGLTMSPPSNTSRTTRREALSTSAKLLAVLTLPARYFDRTTLLEEESTMATALRIDNRSGSRATRNTPDAELRALFDAPLPGWFSISRTPTADAHYFGCCADCAAIRAESIVCEVCGYQGPPLVEACECEEKRVSNILHCERALAEPESTQPGDFTHADYRRFLAEELARAPEARCPIFNPFAHKERPPDNRCGHGSAYCPVCASDSDDGPTPVDDAGMVFARLREIRSALVARGLI